MQKIVSMVCLIVGWGLSQNLEDLRRELRQIKQKDMELQRKIDAERPSIEKARLEFKEYQANHSSHLSSLKRQLDSLGGALTRITRERDSLAAFKTKEKSRSSSYVYSRKRLRKSLLEQCDSLRQLVEHLPPGNIRQQLSAIDFLHSELSSGSAEESEAIERVWQIQNAIEENGQTIQVYRGPSPINSYKGADALHTDWFDLVGSCQ